MAEEKERKCIGEIVFSGNGAFGGWSVRVRVFSVGEREMERKSEMTHCQMVSFSM